MAQSAGLIPRVVAHVEQYMKNFGGSYDFNHIKRVLGISLQILSEVEDAASLEDGLAERSPTLDRTVVTLAALLHDIGDWKYLKQGEDGDKLVCNLLLDIGADGELAGKVQVICSGVSYSSEIQDPAYVKGLIEIYAELAVVQDADRLDAIRAVGIGRVFTYDGAKSSREMGNSMDMLEIKLLKLEKMTKTKLGRRLAMERTERLRTFRRWCDEEVKIGEGDVFEREMGRC